MSHSDDVAALIRRGLAKGLLIDTNLLLVYFIGQYKREWVGKHKRTTTFDTDDYDLLNDLIARCKKIITTPSILTEVSNLARHCTEPRLSECFKLLGHRLMALDERHVASCDLVADEYWCKLGLTDCAIRQVAAGQYVVLTDDWPLVGVLQKCKVAVVNYNNLRLAGWQR